MEDASADWHGTWGTVPTHPSQLLGTPRPRKLGSPALKPGRDQDVTGSPSELAEAMGAT